MIIYKDFEFEMSHRLSQYKGDCRNIHGHTYRLTVGVQMSHLDKKGLSIDFKALKEIVNERIIKLVDHAIWLNHQSKSNEPIIKALTKDGFKMILTGYNPTAECMVLWMWANLKDIIPLYTLTLYETPTSRVTINKADFDKMFCLLPKQKSII